MAKLKSSSLGGPAAIAAGGALFDVDALSTMMGYDPESPIPPESWPDFSAGIAIEFCCPKCAYGWRGNPQPNAAEELPADA